MKRKLLIASGITFGLLMLFVVGVAISTWMIQYRVPVRPLNSLTVHGDANYAYATGTMFTEGERGAMPLQTSEIKCSSQSRECLVATALVVPRNYLHVSVDSYPVTEWTVSHLIFEDEAACVTNTYTINWVSKSVTGIRVRNKTPKPGVDCSAILTDELRVSLRDGFQVGYEEEQRAYPAFIKALYTVLSMWR